MPTKSRKVPGQFEPGDLVTPKVAFTKLSGMGKLDGRVATVIQSVATDEKGEIYYKLKWSDPSLDDIAPNVGAKALKHAAGDPDGRRRIPLGGRGDWIVEYDSNNSGGSWWLKDEDWETLEQGGWQVDWESDPEVNMGRKFLGRDDDRFLGALAQRARKRFTSMGAGIREWEELTGQDSAAVGCSCCGVPHNFSAENEKTKEHKYWSTTRQNTGSSYGDD